MGYYRCITNKNTKIEFDSSYTVIVNNYNIMEYPLKGNCTFGFNDYGNNFYPIMGNNITNCSYTFYRCTSFNQPVTIPNNVTNCAAMFSGCSSFNQPIIIPNNVTNCFQMFYDASNFNQSIIIPNNVNDCRFMFYNTRNFESTIKIYNPTINCYNMLGDTNNSLTKNVYCSNLETIKNVYLGLTWAPIVNGVCNVVTNIYLYTNIT